MQYAVFMGIGFAMSLERLVQSGQCWLWSLFCDLGKGIYWLVYKQRFCHSYSAGTETLVVSVGMFHAHPKQ